MEIDDCLKNSALTDDEETLRQILSSGINPNYKGGWPIRVAARSGSAAVVRSLIQYGANPHLLSESGASTLQLAVYSGKHWDQDTWTFLLSCCDSSQLADGAAVAIIFNNIPAFQKIMETGRCNTNIPTTLTGKTLEQLCNGYKLQHLLNPPPDVGQRNNLTPVHSPRIRQNRTERRILTPLPYNHTQRNLSPSVARFFYQTATQTSLTPPRSLIENNSSPQNCSMNNWPL